MPHTQTNGILRTVNSCTHRETFTSTYGNNGFLREYCRFLHNISYKELKFHTWILKNCLRHDQSLVYFPPLHYPFSDVSLTSATCSFSSDYRAVGQKGHQQKDHASVLHANYLRKSAYVQISTKLSLLI